tara:strand:- start:696 stop:857 length:162 start_codon:yes stop_codon:yes gene_type:complete
MIKDLKNMEESIKRDLDKLTQACESLVKETNSLPSIEDQIKQIVKIQGDQFNE